MTLNRADGTEITCDGHYKIHPVYLEESANRGVSRDFAERAWQLFLEKGDDYTKCLVLEKQDHVTRFLKSPFASEGAKGSFSPSADPNIDKLSGSRRRR